MVKVSVEVRDGAARFDIAVRAQSIRRALSLLVGERHPNGDVRLKFPIEPEGFFVVEDPTARAGMVGFARSDGIAA